MKKWTDFSYIVSIPLGTINTILISRYCIAYRVSIPLGTINTKSERHRDLFMNVSIPLGTINTANFAKLASAVF